MIKNIFKQKGTFFKSLLILFLISSCLTLFFTSYLQYQLNEVRKKELINQEDDLIHTESEIVFGRLNMVSNDLMYVLDCLRLNDSPETSYSEVKDLWEAFSDRRKIYDQIRYIDVNGDELVRINYTDGDAYVVADQDLQNKADRYYFTDTIVLHSNQIYISELDLNIENGKIEVPIKPMIRMATPYYVDSQLKGIVILNYLADDMLLQVNKIASFGNGKFSMLNSDGYWLYDSQDKEHEWAFMYEDRADITFASAFPTVWESVSGNDNAVEITEEGVFVSTKLLTSEHFTFDHIYYSFHLGFEDWILVSSLSSDTEDGYLFTQSIGELVRGVVKDDYYVYLIILIVSFIIATLAALNKDVEEQIKYYSEYDTMTDVYNRRTGFEKLTELNRYRSEKSAGISVCFIDINGLKQVNDALGHVAGDELIRSVVSGIKQNIRKNDFVARLGGDEFLIIFENLDEKQAEEIWLRIVEDYERINQTENRKYLVSVSHGIEAFNNGSNQYIDAVINSADEKMYEEKRRIKKDLNVLRDFE